jgi:alpha,alpha-trehalose phosphorylase
VHLASLAGAYLVLIAGFGGLRLQGDTIRFSPRLPNDISRLCFTVLIHGRRLRVEINHDEARYLLLDGDTLKISHHGTTLTLAAATPSVRPVPPISPRPRPSQPVGRAPTRRQATKTVPRRSGPTAHGTTAHRAG